MNQLREMLTVVQENIAKVLSMANLTMTWIDVIEIAIISFLFYHILLWIKSTRAWNLFKGIMVILIFVLIAALFQMSTILWIAENVFSVAVVAIAVIFQPEMRKALEDLGRNNFFPASFEF